MPVNKRPATIRLGDYTCSPVRSRTGRNNRPEWYWWMRLRREGERGQWSIGWCETRDQATQKATAKVVELSTARPPSAVGSARLVEALDAYYTAVETMTRLRPNTRRIRQFAGRQMKDWATEAASGLTCGRFNEEWAGAYVEWLHGHGYKLSTVQALAIGARVFVRWAHKDWGVPDVKFPPVKVPARDIRIPSEEDIRAVVAVASPRLGALLLVLAYTGMRAGEALSRTWADVDLKRGVVAIGDRDGWKPKTEESYRVVGLDDECLRLLRELGGRNPTGPVFTSPTKSPIRDYTWKLERAVRKAGVSKFTFHDLRRHVSEGLRQAQVGVKAYQQAMGHSIQTAMREYQLASEDEVLMAFRRGRAAHGKVRKFKVVRGQER